MGMWVQLNGGVLEIVGELERDSITDFEQALAGLPPLPEHLTVELSGFDIADGVSAVAAVNAMRTLARGRQLSLHGAPQLLAHNLYRVAALEEDGITLYSTREEEPYG